MKFYIGDRVIISAFKHEPLGTVVGSGFAGKEYHRLEMEMYDVIEDGKSNILRFFGEGLKKA